MKICNFLENICDCRVVLAQFPDVYYFGAGKLSLAEEQNFICIHLPDLSLKHSGSVVPVSMVTFAAGRSTLTLKN